jgi:hypothetical protein
MAKADEKCAECGNPPGARGLTRGRCKDRCYKRHHRILVNTGIHTPRPLLPARERLLDKVVAGWGGCWIWTGYLTPKGYGRFTYLGNSRPAHRVSYELHVGPIPEGLEIDHLCHTRSAGCSGDSSCPHRRCVNPDHLEPVTPAENQVRSPFTLTGSKARSTR